MKKKPVWKLFLFANENIAAFNRKQLVQIQKYTIRQVFKKAFPKFDFTSTKIFMQKKIG